MGRQTGEEISCFFPNLIQPTLKSLQRWALTISDGNEFQLSTSEGKKDFDAGW